MWSAPTPVLKFDPQSMSVTVAGKKGRFVDAAVEDVR